MNGNHLTRRERGMSAVALTYACWQVATEVLGHDHAQCVAFHTLLRSRFEPRFRIADPQRWLTDRAAACLDDLGLMREERAEILALVFQSVPEATEGSQE